MKCGCWHKEILELYWRDEMKKPNHNILGRKSATKKHLIRIFREKRRNPFRTQEKVWITI